MNDSSQSSEIKLARETTTLAKQRLSRETTTLRESTPTGGLNQRIAKRSQPGSPGGGSAIGPRGRTCAAEPSTWPRLRAELIDLRGTQASSLGPTLRVCQHF